MLKGYTVQPQQQGEEEVFVKRIKIRPNVNKLGVKTGMSPIKFPMLKVVIGNGAEDHRFELRWSNFTQVKDADGKMVHESRFEPGKFKIVRVDFNRPHLLYVEDVMTNRKMKHPKTGKLVIDYIAMAVMFGTTQEADGKWTFGPLQTFEQMVELFGEFEHVRTAFHKLTEMFGEDVARVAIRLITSHELFQTYHLAAAA